MRNIGILTEAKRFYKVLTSEISMGGYMCFPPVFRLPQLMRSGRVSLEKAIGWAVASIDWEPLSGYDWNSLLKGTKIGA